LENKELKMSVLGVYRVGYGSNKMDAVLLVDELNELVLPIFIGEAEAFSIQAALEGIKPERPLTHDLLTNILSELDVELEKVTIDGLIKDVFTATLHLREGERRLRIDARPSDSIALALRTGSEIYADRSLLEHMVPRSSIKLPDKDEEEGKGFIPP
jgi:bifunctional DNase/RNase